MKALLAAAVVRDVPALLLDCPTRQLDAVSSNELKEALRRFKARGRRPRRTIRSWRETLPTGSASSYRGFSFRSSTPALITDQELLTALRLQTILHGRVRDFRNVLRLRCSKIWSLGGAIALLLGANSPVQTLPGQSTDTGPKADTPVPPDVRRTSPSPAGRCSTRRPSIRSRWRRRCSKSSGHSSTYPQPASGGKSASHSPPPSGWRISSCSGSLRRCPHDPAAGSDGLTPSLPDRPAPGLARAAQGARAPQGGQLDAAVRLHVQFGQRRHARHEIATRRELTLLAEELGLVRQLVTYNEMLFANGKTEFDAPALARNSSFSTSRGRSPSSPGNSSRTTEAVGHDARIPRYTNSDASRRAALTRCSSSDPSRLRCGAMSLLSPAGGTDPVNREGERTWDAVLLAGNPEPDLLRITETTNGADLSAFSLRAGCSSSHGRESWTLQFLRSA